MYDPQSYSQYDALVFDMDGTLVDSMPAHFEVWQQITQKYQLPFDETTFYEMGGIPTLQTIEILAKRARLVVDAESIAQEKEALFKQGNYPLIPRNKVIAIARYWQGKKPMAIATGADTVLAHKVLKELALTELFSAVVCSEDVENHKPAPDVFALAAKKLGVNARNSVAFEDTDIGRQAAESAGFTVIDVRNSDWK